MTLSSSFDPSCSLLKSNSSFSITKPRVPNSDHGPRTQVLVFFHEYDTFLPSLGLSKRKVSLSILAILLNGCGSSASMATSSQELELDRYSDRYSDFKNCNLGLTYALVCTMYNEVSWTSDLQKLLRLSMHCSSKIEVDLLLGLKVDKAGATLLFEEPNKGGSNVGVVESPVRFASLANLAVLRLLRTSSYKPKSPNKPKSPK